MTKPLLTALSFLVIATSSHAKDGAEETQTSRSTQQLSKLERHGGAIFIIELQANTDEGTGEQIPLEPAAIDTTKTILEKRLRKAGYKDAILLTTEKGIELQMPKFDLDDFKSLKDVILPPAKLTLHKRHPQSEQLAAMVASGEETVPGFRAYPQEIKDPNGKVIGKRHVLVKRRPALTGKEIANAWPDLASNSVIFIELTPAGAKQMETFTRSLDAGRDHIITILDGKVINDAILQAEVLSKHFSISGLDNLKECEHLCNGLNNPLENTLILTEARRVTPKKQTEQTPSPPHG